MRKICVVITARPSYSRIKTALIELKKHSKIELQIIVAASALLDRYGSAVNYIEKDGFYIDAKVYNILEGENPTTSAKTTGLGIIELSSVFENIKPDIVVTIADRFETMATAIAASYMNIPLAHIQGGEVTGNIDEKVRHAVTKLSDYHFVASKNAYDRVLKLGESSSKIYNTGCPSIDLAKEIFSDNKINFDIEEVYGGVGSKIDLSKEYIVVMQHPVTNELNQSRKQITETLKAIEEINMQTLWFWPNVDAGSEGTSKGIRSYREKKNLKNVHFFKNLESKDFLKLIYNSKCLIGNSSVGIRESSYLGVPVVNIGSRQNRRARGENIIDVDYNHKNIKKSILHWLNNDRPKKSKVYGGGNAGKKITEILSDVELQFHKTINY
ncbi:UDP-N-acetylglucosamine 2-epimerase [Flavobacteriaceae bacterium]|nr:UDP-N-acetylglucosamine 2-epimerase [Flavobacteriaceae bacterium]